MINALRNLTRHCGIIYNEAIRRNGIPCVPHGIGDKMHGFMAKHAKPENKR
jgi:hypothetical protein